MAITLLDIQVLRKIADLSRSYWSIFFNRHTPGLFNYLNMPLFDLLLVIDYSSDAMKLCGTCRFLFSRDRNNFFTDRNVSLTLLLYCPKIH